MRRQPLGLKEDLVRCFIGETMDFVLDGRTIARPDTLDYAGKHRASVQRSANNVVGLLIRMGNPAR